ncbi:MAG: hypothetical protein IT208_03865 [Chthonomonadales bacterium]|nr:hypothetical protein [Chthonomonadales bacterium]
MLRKRVIGLLTSLLLLMSLLTARAAAWFCEGRVCSTTVGYCCCLASASTRHSRCGGAEFPLPAMANVCPAECACVMVVSDGTPHMRTAASWAVPSSHPLLPARPAWEDLALAVDTVAHSVDTRGPPSSSCAVSLPTLRAPPVSRVPHFQSI